MISYRNRVLANNPLSYYPLSESNGTVATDLGRRGLNGTVSGTVTLGSTGLIATNSDTSYLFTNGQVTIPTTGFPTGGSPFSFEAWAKVVTGSGDFNTIVQYGLISGNNNGLQLYYRNSQLRFDEWAWNTFVGANDFVGQEVKHYLTVVYDGAGTVTFYIDGGFWQSTSITLNVSFDSCLIGNDGAGDPAANINIAHVGFYDYALSADQIIDTYRAGVGIPNTGYSLLPGQTVTENGISNYLFGAGTTGPFGTPNLLTSSTIQGLAHDSSMTVLRSFTDVLGTDSDATLDSYYAAAQAIGVPLLINIIDPTNDARAQYIVTHYGSKCLLYEFGNEPDNIPLTATQYSNDWNTTVPHLRSINASAKFFGPVVSYGALALMDTWMSNCVSSGVLPDGISFHKYAGNGNSSSDCTTKAKLYTYYIHLVRALALARFGVELPVLLTEWNYDPGNPPPSYGNDPTFMIPWMFTAWKAIQGGLPALTTIFNVSAYAGSGGLDLIDHSTQQPRTNGQYATLKTLFSDNRPHPLSRSRRASGRIMEVENVYR